MPNYTVTMEPVELTPVQIEDFRLWLAEGLRLFDSFRFVPAEVPDPELDRAIADFEARVEAWEP